MISKLRSRAWRQTSAVTSQSLKLLSPRTLGQWIMRNITSLISRAQYLTLKSMITQILKDVLGISWNRQEIMRNLNNSGSTKAAYIQLSAREWAVIYLINIINITVRYTKLVCNKSWTRLENNASPMLYTSLVLLYFPKAKQKAETAISNYINCSSPAVLIQCLRVGLRKRIDIISSKVSTLLEWSSSKKKE